MKISPKIYAKTLAESAGKNNQQIAARFWANLQKNKQYKDLPKILDLMDTEAALQENKNLVKIFTKNALSTSEIDMIKEKFEKKSEKAVILKNITDKNVTGIIALMDDKYIDLTVEDKVKKMKKIISN